MTFGQIQEQCYFSCPQKIVREGGATSYCGFLHFIATRIFPEIFNSTVLQCASFRKLICREYSKRKVLPQQAEVAQGVPGRLRPRIFLTFGTTRVVGRQPYVPAAFTPGEIPGTHFQRLSRFQGTWFCR